MSHESQFEFERIVGACLRLYHVILEEGKITGDHTAVFGLDIDYRATIVMRNDGPIGGSIYQDIEFVKLASAVALACDISDAYYERRIESEDAQDRMSTLARSAFGGKEGFAELLQGSLNQDSDAKFSSALDRIYEIYVRKWWLDVVR
jgi:hypothetical protein